MLSFLFLGLCILTSSTKASPFADLLRTNLDNSAAGANLGEKGIKWRPFGASPGRPFSKAILGASDGYFPHFKDNSEEPTPLELGNLKHFVSDLKSKLRNEFTALIALADAEQSMMDDDDAQGSTNPVLANHPSMIAFAGRKRRFYPF